MSGECRARASDGGEPWVLLPEMVPPGIHDEPESVALWRWFRSLPDHRREHLAREALKSPQIEPSPKGTP